MYKRYAKTLKRLHAQLQELRNAPFSRTDLLLEIQETLIKKIKHVEARISDAKKANDLDLALRYQHLLHALKTIGDGLAFLYIDRWDIKPLGRNNRPGFISGKAGLVQELKVLRRGMLFRPVLLADLTNCLRHGDVYAFRKDSFPAIIELKSSRGGGRAQRQKKRLQNVTEYLRTDRAEGTIIKDQLLIRRETTIDLVEHVDEFNRLISQAVKLGRAFDSPEKGVLYIVDNGDESELPAQYIKELKEPICWFVNAEKYNLIDFVPFSLTIHDSEAFLRFLDGSLLVLVAFDADTIRHSFRDKGLIVEFIEDSEWFMKLSGEERKFFQVSRNFVGRVACEFLSLNWMIEELASRYTAVFAEKNGALHSGVISPKVK